MSDEYCEEPGCGKPKEGSYGGTPVCRQAWAGDPRQYPRYDRCILKRSYYYNSERKPHDY